jgi:isopentenyl-diphosphate delta-isomerase
MSSSVEEQLWQGCTENGEFSRAVTLRECQYGALHATAHLWLWRLYDGQLQFLSQQRSMSVATWQGFWDISAAGHIDAGFNALQTVRREAAEELGLRLSADDLQLLFVFRQIFDFVNPQLGKIIENEFQWVYGFEVAQDRDFALADGEVSEVKWFTVQELRAMVNGTSEEQVVPHGQAYFEALFSALERIEHGRAIIGRGEA